MSTYKEIIGKKIKKVSSDPSVTTGEMWYNSSTGTFRGPAITEAWSTGSPLARAYFAGGGCGIQTAALAFAGWGGSPSASQVWTEEYNGTGWETGGNMNNNRHYMGGLGASVSAGLSFGGEPTSPGARTEEYNGTAWTEVNAMPGKYKYQFNGTGTQTAGLSVMGYVTQPPGNVVTTSCFEYDGTNWTAGGSSNTARMSGGASGTQTATIAAGGLTPPPNAAMSNVEDYNGASWTNGTALPTATARNVGFGTQTSAIMAAGGTGPSSDTNTTVALGWDGTSWSSKPSMATARRFTHSSSYAPSTAGLVFGGYTTTFVASTEEWNSSLNVITAGAWAAGGTLNTGRQRTGGFGNAQTSAVVAAGASAPPATAMNKTEEYNGTSWTEVNAVNTARYNMTAFGTEPAGVLAGVGTPSVTYGGTTEEYNGTNWTTVNPYSAPGANYRSSCGPQTAGLLAGGVAPAPAEMTNAVEEYDGTNWTAGGTLPQFQSYSNMAGTQTAAINGGGNAGPAAPGPVSANAISLEYNGTGWTAGPNANLFSDRLNSFNGGSGTQTAAMFVGGDGVGTATYDGTTFVTAPSVPAARGETSAAGLAPSTAACIFAGGPVPSVGNTTQEFTGETTAANIGDFTTS